MTHLRLGLAYFATILTLSGCMTTPEHTKDEARTLGGLSASGDDICDLEGWYDDGVCDDFCVEIDPGCPVCAAVPSCSASESEHTTEAECPADTSCRPQTLCGATIWCADTASCAGRPTCEAHETEHARWQDCPADGSCREVTDCATVWCSSTPEVMCAGPNPEGCLSTGCATGSHCDTTMGTAPSGCVCSPESGSWACTPDLNGGICVEDE